MISICSRCQLPTDADDLVESHADTLVCVPCFTEILNKMRTEKEDLKDKAEDWIRDTILGRITPMKEEVTQEYIGVPRLYPVISAVQDLRKINGESAELVWDFKPIELDPELREQMRLYSEGLSRYFKLVGL